LDDSRLLTIFGGEEEPSADLKDIGPVMHCKPGIVITLWMLAMV